MSSTVNLDLFFLDLCRCVALLSDQLDRTDFEHSMVLDDLNAQVRSLGWFAAELSKTVLEHSVRIKRLSAETDRLWQTRATREAETQTIDEKGIKAESVDGDESKNGETSRIRSAAEASFHLHGGWTDAVRENESDPELD
jgi:hypothetical protein